MTAPTLSAAILAVKGATEGPWCVAEDRIPWALPERTFGGQTVPAKTGEHVARQIVTEWDHPQSHALHVIAGTATGITTEEGRAVHFTHIDAPDAAAIVAAVNWLKSDEPKELLAVLGEARGEIAVTADCLFYANTGGGLWPADCASEQAEHARLTALLHRIDRLTAAGGG